MSGRAPGSRLGVVVAGGIAAASQAVNPYVVGRVISLDWNYGDPTQELWGLHWLLVAVAGAAFLARRPIGDWLHRRLPARRDLALRAGVLSASLGLVVVGAEGVFRVAQYPFSNVAEPSETALGVYDDVVGWAYRPGYSEIVTFPDIETPVPVHFDRDGARAGGPQRVLDATTPTILFVGGSFTMGHGVPYEESFPGRVDTALAPAYQVANFGVQGHGTDQALLQLERHLDRFETRVVVYTFIRDHIVRNAVADRRLLFRHARFLGTKPAFRVTPDGRLVQRSHPRRFEPGGCCRVVDAARFWWTTLGPTPGRRLTLALVHAMHDLARSRGADLLIVEFPRTFGEYGRSARVGSVAGRDSLFTGEAKLTTIDLSVGAPAGWNDWVLADGGHPDARAHRWAASAILARLASWGISRISSRN